MSSPLDQETGKSSIHYFRKQEISQNSNLGNKKMFNSQAEKTRKYSIMK